MFQTIGRTWELIKMSWAVLKQDRELVLFPVMSAGALAILAGLMFGIGSSLGTVDRLSAAEPTAGEADIVLLAVTYFVLAFVVIYFNSALIGAAMIRLAGGDPTVGDGLRMANKRLPQILGWALISATVGLILQLLRNQSRDNMVAQIVLGLVGGVWAYLTYFVVPILVAEGLGPIGAIRSSGSLFKRTWGEQVTSNVGFGILGIVAVLIGALPAVLVAAVSIPAGIAVAVVTVGLALAIVSTLEGIFKAALYGYVADGRVPEEFTRDSLAGAYQYRGGGARPYRPS
jgi:hypothetical protein